MTLGLRSITFYRTDGLTDVSGKADISSHRPEATDYHRHDAGGGTSAAGPQRLALAFLSATRSPSTVTHCCTVV